MVLLMVWLGCYTQTFMPSISSANAHILDQTRAAEEFRVLATPKGDLAEVSHAR
jgi:hypothetical protein